MQSTRPGRPAVESREGFFDRDSAEMPVVPKKPGSAGPMLAVMAATIFAFVLIALHLSSGSVSGGPGMIRATGSPGAPRDVNPFVEHHR